jgi:hypothetical protein
LIVLAFDVDANGAGDKAVQWWGDRLGDKALRIQPTAHDVTDMWKAGEDLQAWLEPYTLWVDRDNTSEEIEFRQGIRADMEAWGYRLMEVV